MISAVLCALKLHGLMVYGVSFPRPLKHLPVGRGGEVFDKGWEVPGGFGQNHVPPWSLTVAALTNVA